MKTPTTGVTYDNYETVTTNFNEIARIIPYVWTNEKEYNGFRPTITPLNQAVQPKIKRNVLQKSLQLLSKVTTWRRYNILYPNQGLDGNGELNFKEKFDFWYMDVVILIVVASTYSVWGGKSSLLGADNLKYGKRTSRRKLATEFYNKISKESEPELRVEWHELNDVEIKWRSFFDFLFGYDSIRQVEYDSDCYKGMRRRANQFNLFNSMHPLYKVDTTIRPLKKENKISVPNPFIQWVWLDNLFAKKITEEVEEDFNYLKKGFNQESEVLLERSTTSESSSCLLFQLIAMLYPQSQEKLRSKLTSYVNSFKNIAQESPLVRSYVSLVRGIVPISDITSRTDFRVAYGMLNSLARPANNKSGVIKLSDANDETLRKLVEELEAVSGRTSRGDVDRLKALENKFRAIDNNTKKWRRKWGKASKSGSKIQINLSNLPVNDLQMLQEIKRNIEETRDVTSLGQSMFTIWWENYEVDLATLLN